ncbi:hypothetical protein JMM61_19610 [Rhodovulum sulfidophilum]|uniref:hypothetical protein n=1 Tax=Rhodovulum sulfidophilum TaxID=35806 RepID=UPI0019290762|nr:hypothetical protein [Rhodovulum sulfidophilum]MBL3587543.1 hypothetical protein [Rhodovulum sulfidophilum]
MQDSDSELEYATQYRSVFDELRNVMPHGTFPQPQVGGDAPTSPTWEVLPALPTDVFGAVAHLLRVSGTIGWFEPSSAGLGSDDSIFLSAEERIDLEELAKAWRTDGESEGVQDLWTELLSHKDACLRPRLLCQEGRGQGSLDWCKVAFKLILTADMAAEGLGRPLGGDEERVNVMRDLLSAKNQPDRGGQDEKTIAGSSLRRRHRHPASMTERIDTDVVCVLPKGRIAQVGCTLRSLSANLALLPPRATVRCQWAEPVAPLRHDDRATLDILLIPAPFEIQGIDFEEVPSSNGGAARDWGNFSLKQSWIEDPYLLEDITIKLIRQAKKQTKSLNAIIFPEYALDWGVFGKICDAAWRDAPELEFIISGSSNNCDQHEGNHVLTALRHEKSGRDNRPWISAVSRRKHHRWRLDARQVSDYALASALKPTVACWWESHKIMTPELYFHRFRQSSTFVTMICEDLARSDPCHEIIRSVGPNLVFALLMDGPQLPGRWGARYASSLADDPGCSVMTLTSWGLIRRVNQSGKYPPSRAIALWKDETGSVEQIMMPPGDGPAGVLVSLAGKDTTDRTIDGRCVSNWSWRFHGQQPILLNQAENHPRHRLMGLGLRACLSSMLSTR